MFTLIISGMRRRFKEILPLLLVTFIVTFFMSGVLMIQNILTAYITEENRDNYGDWVIGSEDGSLSHPYLTEKGCAVSGPLLYSKDREPLGSSIGCIDQSLVNFGRIGLYEGRLPEKDDEIAADLTSLKDLGLSYDLGQTVTVYWQAEDEIDENGMPVLKTASYTLVGTLKPMNGLWKSGYRMPNLVITKAALNSYGETTAFWYYRMDPELKDIDAEAFFESFRGDRKDLVFNSFVYKEVLWDNTQFYRITTLAMIFVAVFGMTWLLSAYTEKRRKEYFRYRSLGASRGRLNSIIFAECMLSTVPAAVFGMVLSYGISAYICRFIAERVRLEGFFAFDKTVFLTQLTALFGTLFLSVFLVFLRTGDRRLAGTTSALSEKAVSRIRKKFTPSKAPEKEFFLRRNKVRPVSGGLSWLFAFIVMGMVLICFLYIENALTIWREQKTEEDFLVEIKGTVTWYMEDDRTFFYTAFSPFTGVTDDDLQELLQIYGIGSIKASTQIHDYGIAWEGLEDSPFAESGKGRGLGCAIDTYPDSELVKKISRIYGRPLSKEEAEAFDRGELAVLIRPYGVSAGYDPEIKGIRVKIIDEDPTLPDGSTVYLSRIGEEDERLPVKVILVTRPQDIYVQTEVVVRHSWLSNYDSLGFQLMAKDTILDGLLKLKEDAGSIKYNTLKIYSKSTSSYESTDKLLASWAVKQGFIYTNQMEWKRYQFKSYVLEPLLIYGGLLIMILSVYLIVHHNHTGTRSREILPEVRQLKHLGLPEAELKKNVVKAKLRECLPVLFGLFSGTVMIYLRYLFSAKKEVVGTNIAILRILDNLKTQNPWLIALDNTLYCGLWKLLLAALMIYAFMVWYSCRMSLKIYNEEGTHV